MEPDIEEVCDGLRKAIGAITRETAALHEHGIFKLGDQGLSPGNVPSTRNANMHANITLAFRHLEDARMRLGKVMQAAQGGISKFDVTEETESTPAQ